MNYEIQQKSTEILREYSDLPSAYAHISNQLLKNPEDEALRTIQRELERRMVARVMQEYSWEQTPTGEWQYDTTEDIGELLRKVARNIKG